MNQNHEPHLHFTHLILAVIAPRFPSLVHFSKRFPIRSLCSSVFVFVCVFAFCFCTCICLNQLLLFAFADYLIGTRVCTDINIFQLNVRYENQLKFLNTAWPEGCCCTRLVSELSKQLLLRH